MGVKSPKLFTEKKQGHTYMAYLTILSILFVHENLEDRSIFQKILGGVVRLVTLLDFFCVCVSGSFDRTERP